VCHADVPPAAWFVTTRLTSAGVMKIPSRLEAEALHTAAGTLPLAIEVNAMDDWTVDGSVQRKRTPA
jgi:hypothetical protein